MKKWYVVIILAFSQFVMVLDSTVMNVSISTVVEDLGTTVTSMQAAITFYTLTMAAFMLLGGKLGDVLGRKKAFIIGSIVYAVGSLITGLSRNFTELFIGWSVIEGLGAVLVIPAIASLTATNYKGKDRVTAFAVIGGISGAAAAAGPLIGGFVTTYLSWRYVFFTEVVIMVGVLFFVNYIKDEKPAKNVPKIDISSFILSAVGLVMVVFGMLQSKTWGLVEPRAIPTINGHEIAPLGISIVPYILLTGFFVLYAFYRRQEKLESENKNPLLKVSMLKIPQLKSGLLVLLCQYLVIGAIFFVIPVYLQMTLGYDALKTGLKILPLSFSLIIFSALGTKLIVSWSPKKIIKTGQLLLVIGIASLMFSISVDLKSIYFAIGMFIVGAGVGLLASQLGNINMSAVDAKQTSEVGGAQGVAQNLGSSLGTAVIGSILVGVLTTSFVANINSSQLPQDVKNYVQTNSKAGVSIVSVSQVTEYAESKGLSKDEAEETSQIYAESQVTGLKNALFGLLVISTLSIIFSRNIPNKILK